MRPRRFVEQCRGREGREGANAPRDDEDGRGKRCEHGEDETGEEDEARKKRCLPPDGGGRSGEEVGGSDRGPGNDVPGDDEAGGPPGQEGGPRCHDGGGAEQGTVGDAVEPEAEPCDLVASSGKASVECVEATG